MHLTEILEIVVRKWIITWKVALVGALLRGTLILSPSLLFPFILYAILYSPKAPTLFT